MEMRSPSPHRSDPFRSGASDCFGSQADVGHGHLPSLLFVPSAPFLRCATGRAAASHHRHPARARRIGSGRRAVRECAGRRCRKPADASPRGTVTNFKSRATMELARAIPRWRGWSGTLPPHARSLRARSTSAPASTGAGRLGVCRPSQPQCAVSTSDINQTALRSDEESRPSASDRRSVSADLPNGKSAVSASSATLLTPVWASSVLHPSVESAAKSGPSASLYSTGVEVA